MENPIEWLLSGPAWIAYRTRTDLLSDDRNTPEMMALRASIQDDEQIKSVLEELAEWPGVALKSHKKAGHSLHKLVFIADIGLGMDDPGIPEIVEHIYAHRSGEGIFQIKANISPKYGGTGTDQYVWMLCDAPLILYTLTEFGLGDTEPVQTAVSYLVDLQRENGWPCAVAPEIGKFRGPGRKADPCPYATLLMVQLLAKFPQYMDTQQMRIGVETLLTLWDQRKERRPYLFAMGSGFAKLKAPMVWYDILHVTDVLTQIPWARKDTRLQEMVAIVRSKANDEQRFTPESIWQDWKGWEFGQKKEPSRWVTFLALRMLNRMEEEQ